MSICRHVRSSLFLTTLLLQGCAASSDEGGAPSLTAPDLTAPETGSLRVTISTTGSATDPDGYFVAMDGAAAEPVDVNDVITVDRITVGSHSVVLSGASPDCTVGGANPRTVEVQAGRLASTVFEVGCAVPLNGQIVFASRPRGTAQFRLHKMNLDGTGRTPLGAVQGSYLHASVSPDGRRVYYGNDDGISVVNADGTSPTRLTPDGYHPAVSPDGTMLAFIHRGEVRVMSSDGGKHRVVVTPLPLNDPESSWWPPIASEEPSWSPDGNRIVFAGWTDHENVSIYVVSIDGTNLQELAGRATSPSWSPDGSRIAFVRAPGFTDIFTMRPDGTDLVRLTSRGQVISVRWSLDGAQLIFAGEGRISRINADGSGLADLSDDDTTEDYAPAYIP